MDLNDIWQEHKRFILSLAIGVIVFFAGYLVVTSQFDTTRIEDQVNRHRRNIMKKGRYGKDAEQQLSKLQKQLKERYEQVVGKVAFKVRDTFSLAGKGDPRPHYFLITDQVKTRLRAECNRSDVRLDDSRGAASLGLPQASPTDKDQIERTLIGLDLADRVMTRLLAADADAVSRNRLSRGLREVSRMSIEIGGRGSRFGKMRKAQAKSLFDLIKVQTRFIADSHTVKSFLQKAALGESPIQIEEFTAKFPREDQKMLLVDLTVCAPMMQEGE